MNDVCDFASGDRVWHAGWKMAGTVGIAVDRSIPDVAVLIVNWDDWSIPAKLDRVKKRLRRRS